MAHRQPINVQDDVKAISRDRELVEPLQKQVANALILYMNYKHYHWQTSGPLFRDLHLLFDEFANAVLETVDEFAERIRMIGPDPVFTFEQVLKTASVRSTEADRDLREMVEEADRNSIRVIREMREAAKAADEVNDPGSVDLFSKVVQIHEKQEWWLREILKNGNRKEML